MRTKNFSSIQAEITQALTLLVPGYISMLLYWEGGDDIVRRKTHVLKFEIKFGIKQVLFCGKLHISSQIVTIFTFLGLKKTKID